MADESTPASTRRTAWRYGELTQADVVDAALRFCRRDGLSALTMRKLADELGVSSMGAYHHVKNKTELFDLVADEVLGLIPAPPAELTSWDDQLAFLFERARSVLLEYPGVSDHLLVRSAGHPNQIRLHRIMSGILRDAGFTPTTVERAERVFTHLLFGAVSQEAATVAAARAGGDTLAFTDDAEVFRFGLDLLVDGLRSRRPNGPRTCRATKQGSR